MSSIDNSKKQNEIQKKKQEEFENYNFEIDLRWKEFIEHDLKDQIPKNASEKVIKDIKKMWYKQTVDPDFETGINLDEMSQNDKNKQTENQNDKMQNENVEAKDNQTQSKKKDQDSEITENKDKFKPRQIQGSRMMVFLYHIENLLKAIFITSTTHFTRFSHYLAFFICLLAIYRQLKRPRWNKEYGAALLRNEFAHNLIYMIPYSIFSHSRNIIYFFPLMVHFWLGICEYINLRQGLFYKLSHKVVDRTRQNKSNLLLLKAKSEVYMVGYHLFVILVWSFYNSENIQQNILLIVFYVNFLRIKYMMSLNLQTAFAQFNDSAKKNFDAPETNKIVRWTYKKIYQFCLYMVKFDKNDKKHEKQKN
ncbi:hypothetical protein PPERSA_01743 [Pseudocohnilembus persalinus]|uniref:Uncharacterized protein n=1 Tax=Pseudocohnilembus persalinus TaxID=266149 RepID=A0A0V0R1U1_PSEPJ|nr:hypothetical protein PPERSA_01743 [Pseudocohnilembus persalinus]|eukprot:KRX08282.1 hypothetical protein PPERSA_01743 [Pseudocohnilembus persalinus]